ncbi:MAG: prefoldin subunit beta [archaeon]
MDKETEQQISQLQLLEQNLQSFISQKQNFQAHLFEVENALKELKISKGTAYRIVGAIMIASDHDKLIKDLEEKKEVLELRIKNLQKQEDSVKEKADKIQVEVVKKLKEEK